VDRADEPPEYLVGRIEEGLARELHELGVHAELRGGEVLLTGEVATEERRQLVAAVARGLAPGRGVRNATTVVQAPPPDGMERVA
jgi:osmotically-inducible protein OsmY